MYLWEVTLYDDVQSVQFLCVNDLRHDATKDSLVVPEGSSNDFGQDLSLLAFLLLVLGLRSVV